MERKRRCRHEIYRDILNFCVNTRRITDITDDVGLKHSQALEYLSFLVEKGLLDQEAIERDFLTVVIRLYTTTDLGKQYVQFFERLNQKYGI